MDVNEQNVKDVTERVDSVDEVSTEQDAIESAVVEETPEFEDFGSMTEGELVEKAKELMKSNPESYSSLRSKMDAIKYNFYKKLRAKNEELKQRFIEEGGLPERELRDVRQRRTGLGNSAGRHKGLHRR